MADTAADRRERDDLRSVAGLVGLTFVMWGGLVAWGLRVTISLGLVGTVCRTGNTWILHAVNATMAAVALAAVVAGVRVVRRARASDPASWTVHGREAFMAAVGVLLSGLGLWLILLESSTVFFVDPCG